MGNVSQFFQPPLLWQQFEELCVRLLDEVYWVANAQQVGRPGQAQDGVDVYGRSTRHGIIGIQCKRLAETDGSGNVLPGGPVTRALLRKEAKDALAFKTDLDLWILATTARRDIRVQGWVDDLNAEWKRAGRHRIAMVWTWDECISHLNCFPDLQQWYYRDVIQVRAPRDLDEIILRTIAMAFARPAFEMPLDCESRGDFLQALKDTQRAIRTGELVDRESRLVIRKSIGSYHELNDVGSRNAVRQIDLRLRELRTQLEQGFKSGTITEINGYLEFSDRALVCYLEELRGGCVRQMDDVLRDAGLPAI